MPHLEYFSDSPEPAAPRLQDWLVNDKFLGISEHLAVARVFGSMQRPFL